MATPKIKPLTGRGFILSLDALRQGMADIRVGKLLLTDEQFREAMVLVGQIEGLVYSETNPEWGTPGG